MRADRLLAILLLLQTHTRLSAHELAARLEVCPRTVQRDMLALSAAGAPVYAVRGAHGGWSLLEGFQMDLTGLSSDEANSLGVLPPLQVLDDLGLRKASATGAVKLLASLPHAQRGAAEEVRQRVLVDSAGWRATTEAAPAFAAIQEAVWRELKVQITYLRADGSEVQRTIEPLGLVAKGRVWYVVAAADGDVRTYRVSRMRAAQALAEPVTRPANFDLATYWEMSKAEFTASLPTYSTVLRLDNALLGFMRGMWRYTVFESISEPDATGWVNATVTFENLSEAAFCVLGMSPYVEALEPQELRERVAERAQQCLALYTLASVAGDRLAEVDATTERRAQA